MIDIIGHHGANHAQVVHTGGDVRKQVADGNPGLPVLLEFERRLQQITGLGPHELGHLEGQWLAVVAIEHGLGIEQVHMRRTAGHEEEDNPPGLGGKLWRFDG